MKKIFFLLILCLAGLLVVLVNSCKKDSTENPPTHIGTETSFTEEFETVDNLPTKGWAMKNNSDVPADWQQGVYGSDKTGAWLGFYAYSFTTTQDEFAYATVSPSSNHYSISSWLITPVLSVKNGDKISFYSHGDSAGSYTDRMQVLMNKSASKDVGISSTSVGGFTNLLFDINAIQAASGYPQSWVKYEYTFSGISGKMDTRIAFRYYVSNTTNAKGIGIDLFKFEVN